MRRYSSFLLATGLALLSSTADAATIVGGVPTARNTYSVTNASRELHQQLVSTTNYGTPSSIDPNASFTIQDVGSTSSFSAADLNGIDIFVANFTYSFSMSATEAQALYDYVVNGRGHLVVYVNYASTHASAANVLTQLFGVTFTNDWTITTPIIAGASDLTSGPFDPNLVGQSLASGANAYSKLTPGPNAVAITQLESGGYTRAAYIAPGSLAAGAGGVFFYADGGNELFGNSNATAKELNLNAFSFFAGSPTLGIDVPEPHSLGALAFALALALRAKSQSA